MFIYDFMILHFPNHAFYKLPFFIYLSAHTIFCLLLSDFACTNTSDFSCLYIRVKSFSATKENQLFGLITLFLVRGSLWHRVASTSDIQRVRYARNFALDNVTVGFGIVFYNSTSPPKLPI